MNTVCLDSMSQGAIPLDELTRRHALCRRFCHEQHPDAEGILVFSPLSIYYLTGTLTQGLVYIPLDACDTSPHSALLFVRHALERAQWESTLGEYGAVHALSAQFTWDTLPNLLREHIGAHPRGIAAEMGGLSWAEAHALQQALPHITWTAADACLLQARARKSLWELQKMRTAGAKHHEALCCILPQRFAAARRGLLHEGMSERNITQQHGSLSERDIARISWDVFFQLGHSGVNRMGNFGEECFLGHIAAGDNGNYPSHFNGPLGLKGAHPATPYMGNARSLWHDKHILATDMGFVFEGYHTDKTQVYFSGKRADIPAVAQKAHDACIEIQQRAAEQLRVGAIPADIWADALQRAEKLGISEGFMGLGKNKVPFLGHGIGLVIDEWPVIAPRFLAPLEEGMTLAIEPKVGIAGIGMVGVENTFEVTHAGGVSITGNEFNIIEVAS